MLYTFLKRVLAATFCCLITQTSLLAMRNIRAKTNTRTARAKSEATGKIIINNVQEAQKSIRGLIAKTATAKLTKQEIVNFNALIEYLVKQIGDLAPRAAFADALKSMYEPDITLEDIADALALVGKAPTQTPDQSQINTLSSDQSAFIKYVQSLYSNKKIQDIASVLQQDAQFANAIKKLYPSITDTAAIIKKITSDRDAATQTTSASALVTCPATENVICPKCPTCPAPTTDPAIAQAVKDFLTQNYSDFTLSDTANAATAAKIVSDKLEAIKASLEAAQKQLSDTTQTLALATAVQTAYSNLNHTVTDLTAMKTQVAADIALAAETRKGYAAISPNYNDTVILAQIALDAGIANALRKTYQANYITGSAANVTATNDTNLLASISNLLADGAFASSIKGLPEYVGVAYPADLQAQIQKDAKLATRTRAAYTNIINMMRTQDAYDNPNPITDAEAYILANVYIDAPRGNAFLAALQWMLTFEKKFPEHKDWISPANPMSTLMFLYEMANLHYAVVSYLTGYTLTTTLNTDGFLDFTSNSTISARTIARLRDDISGFNGTFLSTGTAIADSINTIKNTYGATIQDVRSYLSYKVSRFNYGQYNFYADGIAVKPATTPFQNQGRWIKNAAGATVGCIVPYPA